MLFLFRSSYSRTTDAELVVFVAQGNEGAFRELLFRYQNDVYQLIYRFLRDVSEAEDLTQETFLRLFRSAGSYTPQASLRSFLFRIAKNLCIAFIRKKRPEVLEELPEIETHETPQSSLERFQSREVLENCIDSLPENQRMAVLLRYISDLSYQEIAFVMGVTVGAVESLLVRGKKTLRKRICPDAVL